MKFSSRWREGILGQYLQESTIHGVKYIAAKDRHPSERIVWLLAVLSCLGGSIYLVLDQLQRYYENPVIISFQPKETAIARIPFPAITICNVNILKKKIMEEILQKLEEAKNNTDSIRDAMILSEHLSHYCLAASSFKRISNATMIENLDKSEEDFVQTIDKLLHELGNGSKPEMDFDEQTQKFRKEISEYKHRGMHNCSDMIVKCLWARNETNCSDVFTPVYTPHGSCCVFNMMPVFLLRGLNESNNQATQEMAHLPEGAISKWREFKQDDLIQSEDKAETTEYPKNQKSGGKPYGLSLLINPELDSYGSCNTNDGYGFKIIAHSPISFPNIADYGVLVPVNSEVFINVNPEATTANPDDLFHIDVKKRSCYFPGDPRSKLRGYQFYTADNCMDECIADETFKKCQCLRYFMPRNGTQELCGASKLSCSEEVRQNLTNTGRKGHCSDCRPACTEIKYKMQVSQFPLRDDGAPFQYNSSTGEEKNATKPSIVHIFIGTDSINAKERKTLYGFTDLVANAGGLLGLMLGFSIISLVEILYFFTIRAWFQYRSDKEDEDDEDFYSRSSQVGGPKLSAIMKPRLIQDIQHQKSIKEMGYNNWALQASNGITRVEVSSVATSFPESRSRRRMAPNFDLLAGSNGKVAYPYPFLT